MAIILFFLALSNILIIKIIVFFVWNPGFQMEFIGVTQGSEKGVVSPRAKQHLVPCLFLLQGCIISNS